MAHDTDCHAFERVDEPDGSGHCETNGHYECSECAHISLVNIRLRRDECPDCGTKLVFDNNSEGDCPNECDVPAHVLRDRLEYATR